MDVEEEIRTINRNYIATLDWNMNQQWGMTFKLPILDRAHKHLFNETDGPELKAWNFSGIGDIQVLGHYSFYQDQSKQAGIRVGVKLPTGKTKEKNSEGENAERGLQPGSGTTNTLLGAYYNHHAGSLSWYVQGMYEQALNEYNHCKPGRKLNMDVGLSYLATPDINLLLQVNTQVSAKDKGTEAEPENSGGRSLRLSPGFS